VIGPHRCILNGSEDVFTLKIGIVFENLIEGSASAKKYTTF
jgi:hypothetical protein